MDTLAGLRCEYGQTIYVMACGSWGDGESTFGVTLESGHPNIDFNDPILVGMVKTRDPRLFDLLASILQSAFELEEAELLRRQRVYLQHKLEEKQQGKQPASGFIYLLESDQGHYKIGRTKNLTTRFPKFDTFLPFNVILLHTFKAKDYVAVEKQLHERFKDKRGRGEWFALTPEDVAWLTSLTDGGLDEQE